MSTKASEITFVIQGPLGTTTIERPDTNNARKRLMDSSTPAESIRNIREHLPGAKIIISTWKGQNAAELDCDEVVFNCDPGPTVTRFNRKGIPEYENINRQIVSIENGLSRVKTKYAVKLRSDNVLEKFDWLHLLSATISRDPNYAFFTQRVISSTLWAQEYASGVQMPFFFSDFFHAGLTSDLRHLWDLPTFSDLTYDESKAGRRQYKNAPWPNLCVEQKLSIACFTKFRQIKVKHKHDAFNGTKRLSDQIFVNNFISLDKEQLGLRIPERLLYKGSMQANCYSHERWKQLYNSYLTNREVEDFPLTEQDINHLKNREKTLRHERTFLAYKVWLRLIKCYLQQPFS